MQVAVEALSLRTIRYIAHPRSLQGLRRANRHHRREYLAERARTGTLLKRLPTLAEVAAFAASDHASAMTGAIVNLT